MQVPTQVSKPTIEQIKALQEECLKRPQVHLEPVHYFADGVYGRELTIPKNLVVVGKIHRHEHLITLLKGEATIYTNEGMVRIKGPHTWISKPGTKRALYTHQKCVFMAVHLNPTNSKDLDALEADIIIPEDDEEAYLEAIKWSGQLPQS